MRIVIALGGNAILPKSSTPDIVTQFNTAKLSLKNILPVILKAQGIVITHGNGPQVGLGFLKNYYAGGKAPVYPLDIIGAETQGWMGYMIEHILRELFIEEKIKKEVVSVITQVLVDENDPEFKNPTKPIGPFFTKHQAGKMKGIFPWPIKRDVNRGYRITVPSPRPIEIIEKKVIKHLVAQKIVVIAGGGGGIPVSKRENGYRAVAAVIDKDLASACIAKEISADILLILTDIEKVCLYYGTEKEKPIDRMKVKQAKEYLKDGHFPKGSMGPKIEAGLFFLKHKKTGKVIITSLTKVKEALEGKAGTSIIYS